MELNPKRLINIKYFPTSEPIICTIGNLRINKNHECFIHIIHKIRAEIPNVRGWIIGQPVNDEPFHENHLKKVIKKQKLRILLNCWDIILILKKC